MIEVCCVCGADLYFRMKTKHLKKCSKSSNFSFWVNMFSRLNRMKEISWENENHESAILYVIILKPICRHSIKSDSKKSSSTPHWAENVCVFFIFTRRYLLFEDTAQLFFQDDFRWMLKSQKTRPYYDFCFTHIAFLAPQICISVPFYFAREKTCVPLYVSLIGDNYKRQKKCFKVNPPLLLQTIMGVLEFPNPNFKLVLEILFRRTH